MESEMKHKYIEISLMEDGELSIDGQSRPAGNIEIREFEDDEWIGGSYATYDNLVEKVKEALEIDDDIDANDWLDHGGES